MAERAREPGRERPLQQSDPPPTKATQPEEQTYLCDLCGNVMLNLHCKLVCEQCGYKRDCSDP